MKPISLLAALFCMLLLPSFTYGQDTIRLNRKPEIILKSWYPEFKEFPALTVGESKILFVKIPDLKYTTIRDNHIKLISSNGSVQVKETPKPNQYLITVESTKTSSVEFELWFELGHETILISQGSDWEDVRKLYPLKGNRILIDRIKLEIEK